VLEILHLKRCTLNANKIGIAAYFLQMLHQFLLACFVIYDKTGKSLNYSNL